MTNLNQTNKPRNVVSPRWFIAGIVGFVLLIGGAIAYQERILVQGERIILQTIPVDPRHILMGDYVILRYDIHDQTEDLIEQYGYQAGDTVYAVLDTTDTMARVSDLVLDQPTDQVYLKTVVTQEPSWRPLGISLPALEQYYVPEGKGMPIERMRRGELYVEISVHHGQARIVRLLDQELQEVDFSQIEAE